MDHLKICYHQCYFICFSLLFILYSKQHLAPVKVCEIIHNYFNIFNIHFHPSELPSVKYLVRHTWPEALSNVWYIACRKYLRNVYTVHWDYYLARHQVLVTYLFKNIYCWCTTEMSCTVLLAIIFETSVFHWLPVHSNMHRPHNSGFLVSPLCCLPQQGSVYQY